MCEWRMQSNRAREENDRVMYSIVSKGGSSRHTQTHTTTTVASEQINQIAAATDTDSPHTWPFIAHSTHSSYFFGFIQFRMRWAFFFVRTNGARFVLWRKVEIIDLQTHCYVLCKWPEETGFLFTLFHQRSADLNYRHKALEINTSFGSIKIFWMENNWAIYFFICSLSLSFFRSSASQTMSWQKCVCFSIHYQFSLYTSLFTSLRLWIFSMKPRIDALNSIAFQLA